MLPSALLHSTVPCTAYTHAPLCAEHTHREEKRREEKRAGLHYSLDDVSLYLNFDIVLLLLLALLYTFGVFVLVLVIGSPRNSFLNFVFCVSSCSVDVDLIAAAATTTKRATHFT